MIQRLLQIVGIILIIIGIIAGFYSYEIVTEYGDVEKSFTVLFSWLGLGSFTGFILIGLGEVLFKLDDLIKKT